jgi:hypothetical protein
MASLQYTAFSYETHITAKVKQFEALVEKATDTAAQEICKVSNNAVKTVTDQIQHTLTQEISKTQTTIPHQNHTVHHCTSFPKST